MIARAARNAAALVVPTPRSPTWPGAVRAAVRVIAKACRLP